MWRGALARRRPSTLLEHEDAAFVLDAGADVGPVDAVFAEEHFSHSRDRRRSEDLEIRDPIRAHIPALEHEARVVHTMIVVQVADERVAHVYGAMTALDEPVVRAGSVVHHDEVASDFDEVTRALSRERRRGRPGSEQCDLQWDLLRKCLGTAARSRHPGKTCLILPESRIRRPAR